MSNEGGSAISRRHRHPQGTPWIIGERTTKKVAPTKAAPKKVAPEKSAPKKVAPKTKATPKNRGGGGAKDKGPSLRGRRTAVGPVSAVPAAAAAATTANDAAAADDDGNDIVEIIVPARTAVAATPPRNDELLHRRYRTRTKIGRVASATCFLW